MAIEKHFKYRLKHLNIIYIYEQTGLYINMFILKRVVYSFGSGGLVNIRGNFIILLESIFHIKIIYAPNDNILFAIYVLL